MKNLICLALILMSGNALALPKEAYFTELTRQVGWASIRTGLKLPADGAIISTNDPHGPLRGFPLAKNKWPHNKAKGPFETHETFELSLGRIIRAKSKDRKHEGPMGRPGIELGWGTITIRGGWRLHKSVPIHNDYFDGTFELKLLAAVNHGKPVVKVLDFDVTWNKRPDIVVKVLTAGRVHKFFEHEVPRLLEAELQRRSALFVDDLKRRLPAIAALIPKEALKSIDISKSICIDIVPAGLRVSLIRPGYARCLLGMHEFMPHYVPIHGTDRDFFGHGPHVTVKFKFRKGAENNRAFYYHLDVSAAETTKKNQTRAAGKKSFVIYSAPGGTTINRVWFTRMGTNPKPVDYIILRPGVVETRPQGLIDEVVRGHKPKSTMTGEGEVKIWGDHKGDDAGEYTRVQVRSATIVTFELK